ncbi:hypothetical protein Hanom_Chr12g01086761 [Helianthus anomalus]
MDLDDEDSVETLRVVVGIVVGFVGNLGVKNPRSSDLADPISDILNTLFIFT